MNIDGFLGSKGVSALQALLRRWVPGAEMSNSKAALLRTLRQAMLDEGNIEGHLARLGNPERRLLRALLQAPEAKASVDLDLVRGLRLTQGELMQVMRNLVDAGFVATSVVNAWSSNATLLCVPVELAERLTKLMGIDLRLPLQQVSLRAHLEALPPAARRDLLTRHGLGELAGSIPAAMERLTDPDAVLSRVAAQGEGFSRSFARVLHEHAGLAPCRTVFHGSDSVQASRKWREQAEQALVGTVGELPLHRIGIDDTGSYLIIFREVADASVIAVPDQIVAELDIVVTGVDFLIDLRILCDMAREQELRITRGGELFKSAEKRLMKAFVQAVKLGVSPEDLLEMKLYAAMTLGLVRDTDDDRLAATTRCAEWEKRPVEQRVAQVLDALGALQERRYSATGLGSILREQFARMRLGEWCETPLPVRWALSRIMLAPDTWSDSQRGTLGRSGPLGWFSFSNAAALCGHLLQLAMAEPVALGLVDVGLCKKGAAAIRLTHLGERVLRGAPPVDEQPTAGPGLIINPDFEVLVLPEGDVHREPITPALYRLIYGLGRFCDREKATHQTQHYRISRASVERAVLGGMRLDEMTDLLQRHARAPIPQNVEYSLKSWAEGVKLATAQTVNLIEMDDAHALQMVMNLPAIKPYVIRQISPNAVVVGDIPRDRRLTAALREMGVRLATPLAPEPKEDDFNDA